MYLIMTQFNHSDSLFGSFVPVKTRITYMHNIAPMRIEGGSLVKCITSSMKYILWFFLLETSRCSFG